MRKNGNIFMVNSYHRTLSVLRSSIRFENNERDSLRADGALGSSST
jgi:hypothetical protein